MISKTISSTLCLGWVAVALTFSAFGQGTSGPPRQARDYDKTRGREMLGVIKDDLKKKYYDPAFHGMDVEARFKTADEKLKTADSLGQIMGIIAQALIDLDDSHTFFLAPGRSARYEYGWRMQMFGERCFVTDVKPGTDAAAKGLKEGDEILAINNTTPSRDNFWKIGYYFNALRPQPGMMLALKTVAGKETELVIMAKVTQLKRVMDLTSSNDYNVLLREQEKSEHFDRQRFVEIGNDLLIWKMPEFDLEEGQVDDIMGRVRKHKALLLDLRGNPGGAITTLQRLAGYFFDHDLKIADLKGRKEMKPQVAKTRGDKMFKGQIVVLVDSRSASAAEMFARVLQIESRGKVIGDRSAGAVMLSRHYPHESGIDTVTLWGVSITEADVIMTDGKSLEKTGVRPDEIILPTAEDLTRKRDPAMVRAAELLGVKLDPEKAGSFFPIEWRP